MSIELLIKENTQALQALHELLTPAIASLLSQTAAVVKQEKAVEAAIEGELVEEAKPEPAKPVKKERKAKSEPAKVVEPEVDDDPLAAFLDAKEKTSLPPGKRDAAYYEANVKPVLAKLAQLNTQALVAIVRDQYGVKKADQIPPDQWDDLVTKVQAEIDGGSVV